MAKTRQKSTVEASDNGTGKDTAFELKAYKPDDDEIALELIEQWEKKVSYFYGDWHVYENGCWVLRDRREVQRNIRLFLREYRARGVAVAQRRITTLADMMEDECYIADRRLMSLTRSGEKYINLQNGLFNLETFELEQHNPELYFTTQLGFSYDRDADCPHFARFLNTSLIGDDGKADQQMIMLAQEALAYSMTARTDLKASFWLVGKPDSGKSTLISFIRSLMGSLHATIDLNQLASNRFLLSGIAGKRVVTFTEADTNSYLPDALYKAMVGGQDEIYADVKNKSGIAFVPTAKFWWAMNGAPRVNDRSGATLNRLRVILFDHSIPQDKRIGNLHWLLEQERPGVFNWLLYGYQRLQRGGQFTLSERSEAWRENYRKENDTEANYAEQCLDFNPTFHISSQELYKSYKYWCEEYGHKPRNITQIAKEWRRLGLELRGNNGRHYWHGAQLKSV